MKFYKVRNHKLIKMIKPILVVILILFSTISPALATSYISIYLDEAGDATFIGITDNNSSEFLPNGIIIEGNKILGITSELTIKQGKDWKFSFYFNDSLLNVFMPNGAIISNISFGKIKTDENRIIVEVNEGTNIEYVITNSNNYYYYVRFIILVLIIAGLYILIRKYLLKRNKSSARRKNIGRRINKIEMIKEVLNERERLIINNLKGSGKLKMSQLRRVCNIPKASFSRHIQELERKKLIIKSGDGKNKFVELRQTN